MRPRRSLAAGAVLLTAALAGGSTALTTPAAAEPATVDIAPVPAYQGPAFEGWGTSLVWFAHATGDYPDAMRRELFDLVFGEEGLNLNLARYNIGGGNATDVPDYLRHGADVDGWWDPDLDAADEQGPITSTYADRERYADAWDPEDPEHLDASADQAQRWWVDQLAAQRDDVVWEAFSNSPPYFLTESGFVSGGIGDGGAEQIPEEHVDAFTGYLTAVMDEVESAHGIEFSTVDPFNEPNTDYWATWLGEDGWPTEDSRQEGAHVGPERQNLVLDSLRRRLDSSGTSTEAVISAMDETNPGTFAHNWENYTAASREAVGQLNVHTYGTGQRPVVRDLAKVEDKPLSMSEVGGSWSDGGFDVSAFANGTGIATRMIDDMRELEPRSWVFWQPVEDLYNMEKVEESNWGSIFVDFDCTEDGDSARRLADGEEDPSCEILTNAKFNTIRNFTHHIRPGDHFIPSGDAQTAAALNGGGDGLDLVHVNDTDAARTLRVDLSSFGEIDDDATITPVVTTESPAEDPTANALETGEAVAVDPAAGAAEVRVPAQSVTTLVVEGVDGVAEDALPYADGARYRMIGEQSDKALTAGASEATTITAVDEEDASQTWTVERLTDGLTHRERVALRADSGEVLGLADDGSTRLVDADAEQIAADRSLQWFPSTTDGARWSLVNAAMPRALDVSGESTEDGASVGTWQSHLGGNQLWTFDEVVSSDATLEAILLDGEPLEEFSPGTAEYTRRGHPGGHLPAVAAVPSDEGAAVEVEQARPQDRTATITVTAEDGTTQEYAVHLPPGQAPVRDR